MCIHKIITAIVTQISGKNTNRYTRKGHNNVSPWQWPQVRHLYPNFFKLLQIVFFKTNSTYPMPGKLKLNTLPLINKDFLKYWTTTTKKSHLANHHSQARLKRFFISLLIHFPKIQVPATPISILTEYPVDCSDHKTSSPFTLHGSLIHYPCKIRIYKLLCFVF